MAETKSASSHCAKTTDVKCYWKNTEGKWHITWTIADFCESTKSPGQSIVSPMFQAGFDPKFLWCLTIYPMGKTSQRYVSVYLTLLSEATVTAQYSISIINTKGEKTNYLAYHQVFSKNTICGSDNYIERSLLLDREKQLLVRNSLTIFCEMIMTEPPVQYISSFCYEPKLNGLSEDFSELYRSSKLSDITILVKDKKLKAHKAILGARSPVFAAMFEHPMEENGTNLVNIADIEADVMEELLSYIYTGKCPRMKEMAADLLQVSDKYDLTELKTMAELCLSTHLTVYNAAMTLVLADTYNAAYLKKKSIKFLNIHGKDVINTSGWSAVAARPQLVLEAYSAIFDLCLAFDQNIQLKTAVHS